MEEEEDYCRSREREPSPDASSSDEEYRRHRHGRRRRRRGYRRRSLSPVGKGAAGDSLPPQQSLVSLHSGPLLDRSLKEKGLTTTQVAELLSVKVVKKINSTSEYGQQFSYLSSGQTFFLEGKEQRAVPFPPSNLWSVSTAVPCWIGPSKKKV